MTSSSCWLRSLTSCADEPGADLHVPASDEERVKGAVRLVELRAICVVVQDNQHLVQFLHLQLLGRLGDLALPLDDAPQRRLVQLVVVGLLALRVHPQVLLDVLLDGDPAVVDVYAGAEDVDFLKDSAILLQNHADQRHSLARFGRPEEDARAWARRGPRVVTGILCRRKQLDLPYLPYFPIEAGKPGGKNWERCGVYRITPIVLGIKLKVGVRLKYMAWLAHLDRLLGDVTVLHSPFFGSGKLEYYLAARRPRLGGACVDAFEPVANLRRCYLRQDPVFLRSLLRLVGRKVDRRFYFRHLLPGVGLPAHTPCCYATASRESRPPSLNSVRP